MCGKQTGHCIIRLGNCPNCNYQVAFQTGLLMSFLFFLVVNIQCPMLYYFLVLKIKLIISTLQGLLNQMHVVIFGVIFVISSK